MAQVSLYDLMVASRLFLKDTVLLPSTKHLLVLKDAYGKDSAKYRFFSSLVAELHIIYIRSNSILATYFETGWWATVFPKVKDKDRDEFILNEVRAYKFLGFIQTLSRIESNFRIFAAALGMKGRESFWKIQERVLTKTRTNHYKESFDISRTIRNLIHSAGVPNMETKTHLYKGMVYEFKKEIQFTDFAFELNNSLILDWVQACKEITESSVWKDHYPEEEKPGF